MVVLRLGERELKRVQALRIGGKRALQQVLVGPVVARHRPRQARAHREARHAAAGLELAGALYAATEALGEEGQERAR
jgi:hypothetical protein